MTPAARQDEGSVDTAQRICDEAWSELKRSLYVQSRMGTMPSGLPHVSLEEAERRSAVGRSLLERIGALNSSALPHELALTLRLVRFQARAWSREAQWYWTVVDPLGIGLFGLFLPTAYCGGFLLNFVHKQFASLRPKLPEEADRYLALVKDYARLMDQFTARTKGQAARGIRIPKVQVIQARSLLASLKSGVRANLGIPPQQPAAAGLAELAQAVKNYIAVGIEPAFDRAIAQLSDTYLELAPDAVGMGQYPDGKEIYGELVKFQTTLDLTPDEVHGKGLERMAGIESSMRAIEAELGFAGDTAGFLAHMDADPRWRADTIDGVTAVFQRYIDRLTPRFERFFPSTPRASYGVAPLPKSLEQAMTYGYYDPPKEDQPKGRYVFNAANLTRQSLYRVGALTYHELMPGHHLQFATQQESETLHPFRGQSFVNAYIEGWAEYAATFAGEIGLYEVPEERYGRLAQDAFLTSRLVVDTGMNVLGWSLEDARNYMREHSGVTEREVLTESVRYACDIPAQALAYKLGDTQIIAMRERMRDELGERFSIKDFHAAALTPGALPLSDLEWHIEHETQLKVTASLAP